MTEKVRSETRWKPRGAHVGTFWTVVSVSPGTDQDEAQVGLTGPGPCRGYRSIALDEFLRDWECLDRCTVCDSPEIAVIRVVRETHRNQDRPFVHRMVRCEKHLEG